MDLVKRRLQRAIEIDWGIGEIAMPKRERDYTVSSGNVFADLGLPNPEETLAKAELAHRITVLIRNKGLTQVQTAELLGVDQPKVSLSRSWTSFRVLAGAVDAFPASAWAGHQNHRAGLPAFPVPGSCSCGIENDLALLEATGHKLSPLRSLTFGTLLVRAPSRHSESPRGRALSQAPCSPVLGLYQPLLEENHGRANSSAR